MVSQWMHKNTMHGNSLVPMLIGAQGDGKSTFCRMIIPDEQQIYYTDRVDFTKKDEAVKALSRFILINIDEYDSISKRQTAFLKYMLQTVDVKYRNLYESITQQHRRYATFIATTNNPQPLVDETGSRRYMCIKVTGKIDTKTAVNYEQMYAQAIAEIKSGAKAYFNNDDERKMQLSNNDFQQFDCIDEIFSEIFHRPQKGEKSLRLTATEIVQEMKKKYRNIAVNNSNIMRVGHILNRQRYNMIRGNARRYDVAMNNK
jgi:predicted P-loop ATPase